ncbi:MAG: type II secretion system protein GspG [Verrucomicrobiota bacterium]
MDLDSAAPNLPDKSKAISPFGTAGARGIIGILTVIPLISFAAPAAPLESDQNPAKSIPAQVMTIKTALLMYKTNNRALPPTLDALVTPPPDALVKRPLLVASEILDPWGTKFIYKTPGKGGKPYDIYSAGPDGKDGTDDDVHTK